jgi:hypothetical protein
MNFFIMSIILQPMSLIELNPIQYIYKYPYKIIHIVQRFIAI